jgi:beta-N-acetylhexosaminidase
MRSIHRLWSALLGLALTTCASVPPSPIPRIESLTLDEKIGQLFVVPAHGVFMNESSADYQTLVHHVRDNHVGGVLWFVSNVYETAWLNERLQKVARVPLLISADLEAGVGMRFENTTYWPPAMAVAATGDPLLAEEEGRIAAREAKTIGVNHILAPVVDVNVDPDNPVINTRSFGEDPREVARFASAFLRGVQSEGVLATAKHFPGHGDTHVDSHRSLPTLDVTRERLEKIELVPFRAAIEAGVASVMTGHLAVPAIDASPTPVRSAGSAKDENPYATTDAEIPAASALPASLSSKAIDGVLRHDLHFDGLVVTDAFDMGALVAYFDPGEAAVRAIEAGNDQILKSADTDAAIAAVKEAVRSGRLPEARIDASVRRILAAKRRAHHHVGSQQEIFAGIDTKEHRAVAGEIARRAITRVRDETGALPLRKESRILVVHVSDFAEPTTPLAALVPELASRTATRPASMMLDARSTTEDARLIAAAAREADVVLFALAVRTRSGAGHIAVPEAARRALELLPDTVKTIGVAFGSPYVLRDLPTLRTYICAYGTQPLLQVAAVRALYGETTMEGRLPVTLEGIVDRGSRTAGEHPPP